MDLVVTYRMDFALAQQKDRFHHINDKTTNGVSLGRMQTCKYTTLEPSAMCLNTAVIKSSCHDAKSVLGLTSTCQGSARSRRQREFIPEEQKDGKYWFKRKRNNEAAKRSRQRRRMEGILLEGRAVELLRENKKLKATLSAVQYRALAIEGHHDKPDTFSNPNHCFHQTFASVPNVSPWMLAPTASFTTNVALSKEVSDNKHTGVPGLPNDPCLPNVETSGRNINCPDVSRLVYSPGREYFSEAGVSGSYPPVTFRNDYQCNINSGIACNIGHYPDVIDTPSRYRTFPNVGMSFPVICSNSQYSDARGQHAQVGDIEGWTSRSTPLDFDRANKGISLDGQNYMVGPITSERNETGSRAHGRTCTADKSSDGTLSVLPHKLRFKAKKSPKHQNLINRASVAKNNEIKNNSLLHGEDLARWDGANESRSNGQPEKDSCGQYFGSSSHTLLVPNEAKTSEIMSSLPTAIVSGEMVGNGHLRHQLEFLCAEVKTLKQIILAKSD